MRNWITTAADLGERKMWNFSPQESFFLVHKTLWMMNYRINVNKIVPVSFPRGRAGSATESQQNTV